MSKEFDESLEKLGELYEEGKDCLAHISSFNNPHHTRLYNILIEMRDLAAINMQKLHFTNDN